MKERRTTFSEIKEAVHWQCYAMKLAEWAGEDRFEIRRIVDCGERARDRLFYCNNNPYADDASRRPQENDEIKRRMAALGVQVLAESAYPRKGDDAGYTTAIVFDAGADQERTLTRIVREVCGRVNQQLA